MKKNKMLTLLILLVMAFAVMMALTACVNTEIKVRFYREPSGELYNTVIIEEGNFTMPADPIKTGYKFLGWFADVGLTTAFDSKQIPSTNIDVYAKWRKLPDAPKNLTYDESSRQIKWDGVLGAVGYELAMSSEDKETPIAVNNGVVYDFNTPGTYNCYVRAINDVADKSEWSERYNFTIVAPESFVNFMSKGIVVSTVKIENGKVALPQEPVDESGNSIFEGWFVDEAFGTAFDKDATGTETITVYAKWSYKPATPSPVSSIRYIKAKLNAEQKIIWVDNTQNVAKYVVSVFKDTTLVESFEVLASATKKEVVLTNSKYDVDEDYTVSIKTVLTTLWLNNPVESAAASIGFSFEIVPEDTYTVSFMDGNEKKYELVVENGTVVVPELTKQGFVFDKWVTEIDGNVEFVPSGITQSLTVYAKWTPRPQAPQSATFDASTLTLSWTAIEGISADGYSYKIDGGLTINQTTETSLLVVGLTAGEHTINFKITKNDIESEWSTAKFTVDAIYVLINANNGTTELTPVLVENGKITAPVTPVYANHQFVKWTRDNNINSSAIDFLTATFERGIIIYAQWYECPSAVTSAAFVEADSVIDWADIDGVDGYEIKWNGSDIIVDLKISEYKLDLPIPGTYSAKIRCYKMINGIKVYSQESVLDNIVIEFETSLERTASGIIRLVDAQNNTKFVFFAGQSYQISGAVYTENTQFFTSIGDVINIGNKLGEFELQFERDGKNEVRNIIVVPQLSTVNTGFGYADYEDIISSQTENSSFLNTNQAYSVGTAKDEYYLIDLENIFAFGGNYADTEVEYDWKFSIKDVEDEEWDLQDVAPTAVGVSIIKKEVNYAITFNNELNGKVMLIKLSPRFLTNAQYENPSEVTASFLIELNNGVNVYDHTMLKAKFSDNNIRIINIHRNITAKLATNQLNLNGTAVNYSDAEKIREGELFAADVYRRDCSNTSSFVVNGNYFLVDATNVQKINADNLDDSLGQAKSNGVGEYKVQNVHTSVFKLVGAADKDVRVTFNNIEVKGNTELTGNTMQEVSTYSGGHIGILVDTASVDCFNTFVHHTTIAYFFDNKVNINNVSVLDHAKADLNWGNGIYSYGTTAIVLKSSHILRSSGAAVHIEDGDNSRNYVPMYDNAQTATRRFDAALIIDTQTKMENWVTGEEAWFTAWGMGSQVVTLKALLQQNTEALFNKSLTKEFTEDATVQKINFAVMFRGVAGGNEAGFLSQVEVKVIDATNGQKLNEYVHVSAAQGVRNEADPTLNTASIVYGINNDPRLSNNMLLMPLCANISLNAYVQQVFGYANWLAGGMQGQDPAATLSATEKAEIATILQTYGANAPMVLYKKTASNPHTFAEGSQFMSLTMVGQLGYSGLSTVWLQFGDDVSEGWKFFG